jgi:hypothetical protein
MAGPVHNEIVAAAVRWLRRNGCAAILADPFKAACSEQPDAIGWRDAVSMAVEVKASRSDFLADAKKPHRVDPARAVGDWRFYAAPAGVIRPDDLPMGWGLLEWDGRCLKPAHGVPLGNCNWHAAPVRAAANKRAETQLLVSAIHRPAFAPRPGAKLRAGIHFEAWGDPSAEEVA